MFAFCWSNSTAGNHILEPPNLFIERVPAATAFRLRRQVLAELTQWLDDAVKHKLLAGNAMRVYGLGHDTSTPGAAPHAAVVVS